MSYSLRHSTKGFFQYPNNWITNHDNAYKWAARYDSIESAKEVAGTLRSLSGKPLRLEIVVINPPKSEYGFESYETVDVVEPHNQKA